MVSLALALGLADVIAHEAGGTDLDTLFVDEGFGSLDADTLDDVMDTLDSLRDGGRVVGVVSHVAEMRDRIPTQLVVAKARAGSTRATARVTQSTAPVAATRPGWSRLGGDNDRELTRKHSDHEHHDQSRPRGRRPPRHRPRRAPAAQAASPEWKTERGIVLECQGEAHGLRVWTSVYENQRYGNVVQVVIGDPDDGNGSSHRHRDEVPRRRLREGVGQGQRQEGFHPRRRRALRRAHRVYEEFDDAGFLSRPAGSTASCAPTSSPPTPARRPADLRPAFFYDLEVKKIPIV